MAFKIRNFAASPLRNEEDPRIKTPDTLDPNYYKTSFNKPQTALSIEQVKKDSEKYKSKEDNFDEEFEKLENLKINNKGQTVEYGSPEYERLYNEGSIQGVSVDEEGNYRPLIPLDEVVLDDVYKNRKPSDTLDYLSDGMTLGGMSPGYGIIADAANLIFATGRTIGNAVGDTYHGLKRGDFDYGLTGRSAKDMFFAGTGLVPLAGQAASSIKLGNRLRKAAEGLQKSKTLDLIDKIHHMKIYQPAKATKVAVKNIKNNLPKEEKS